MVNKPNFKEKQAESDALFASIGDGAISTNEQGNISRVNCVALEILGFSEDELLGKWFPGAIIAQNDNGELIEPADRAIFKSFVEAKPVSQKMYYLTKQGKYIPVSVTVSPIVVGTKSVGTIEVFRDITKDNEINRMKSEFISIASHQLRTPLTAIQTYANLLASGFRGDLSKGQQELMDIILSSVGRMNDLITTLLDISRIETGKLSLELVSVNLDSLCQVIIQELGASATNKKIDLVYSTKLTDISAVTDQLLITEAYSNLISNAIKYTPDKGKVVVSLKRNTKGGIVMSVKDTGLGIPAKLQSQIYTKFFRAANVVEYDTTGTGLGLYMVKQIADSLGGKTWFTSQEGQGANFYFSLPVKRA